MQLFLVVGSLNSNTVDSPSLSDVGVLLAGEDDIKADAAGSVRWGFGLCWDQASRREKRLDCLAYLFSKSSSLFRSPGMSRLCNPMQSSGRGTGYVWNQLLLWRRWVLWMMNGSRHNGGMANTTRCTRQVRCQRWRCWWTHQHSCFVCFILFCLNF